MAKVLVHLFNHTSVGMRSLEDVIGIIGFQLRALGHTAIWDPNNGLRKDMSYNIQFWTGDDEYNVFVEGFTDPIIEVIGNMRAKGAKILCVATEEPTATGFNHGLTKEFAFRQETFKRAAEHFMGILHLVPGERVRDWYGQYAPTAQAELGFAPNLVRMDLVYDPPFDFVFFGTLSPRRVKMINKLIKRLGGDRRKVLVVKTLPPQAERDALTQQGKIVIQLRKTDEMGLVSSSRCNTALHCGRPVIAEPHDTVLSKPWDQVVTFAPTEEEFFHLALEARKVWRQLHAHQFARFKQLLTPEYCIGEPMRMIGVDLGTRMAA